jgi:PadR family transcriptional regulator PadR
MQSLLKLTHPASASLEFLGEGVSYFPQKLRGDALAKRELDIVRGTLDLLILKTLSWGPLHGYAIVSAIRQQTDKALLVEEGALYPSLYRMESKGWIEAEWGLSGNNRRAKYYHLTTEGQKQLRAEVKTWKAYTDAVTKVLDASKLPVPEVL